MPLGEYLGRRDEEHVARWLAAMWEGRGALQNALPSPEQTSPAVECGWPGCFIAAIISRDESATC
jgi:hypothetical protein